MGNKIFLISAGGVGVLLLLITGGIAITRQEECRDFSQGKVTVEKHTINVALAVTALEQSRGLGGCEHIPKDAGMYFVYTQAHIPTFWMKGMRIPIDIVWIREGKIVGLQEFIPVPQTLLDQELPRYKSPEVVDAVLEIAAGEAQELGLQAGDSVSFSRTVK